MRTLASKTAAIAATVAVAAVLVSLVLLPGTARAVTYDSDEIALVQLVNEYRINNGVKALLLSDILADSADKHNADMATFGFFSHTTLASHYFPVGSSPGDRMALCGYPQQVLWGENLAEGYQTPESVFKAWKNSESHRRNMLGSAWRVVGISRAPVSGSGGWYWTADFGSYVDGTAHAVGTPSPIDTTAPSVAFGRPAQGSNVSGRVTVEITATDNVLVSRVELYGNATLVGTDTSPPYSFKWDTAGMNPGSYALEARAYDPSGNLGSAVIHVSVLSSPTTSGSTTTTGMPTTTTTLPPPSTTTTTTQPSTTTTTVPGAFFTDVQPGSQYYNEISELASDGIISGYEDGRFHPEWSITRGQLAKILVLATEQHTSDIDNLLHPSFSDVPFVGDEYPFDYVEEAAALGIVQGYGDGTFRPNEPIIRVEVALMLARAGETSLATPPPEDPFTFTDTPLYAREAVHVLLFNGLICGKNATTFDPYGDATRGQVAKMIYGLRKVSGR